MSDWVIDAGEHDFESQVLERSKEIPVVVDFWAPWCGPCRTLGPLLERLADEYDGAFVLVKVNVDANPQLAAALRVQSIPMVLGFRDGTVVSEFVGALPESAVHEFLRRVLPTEADRLAAEAEQLLAADKQAEAEAACRAALEQDARCSRALVTLATILAGRGEVGAALELLDRVDPGPVRQSADRLAAELRIRNAGEEDEAALRAALTATPGDLDTRFRLAQVLAAHSHYPEALEEYLAIIRRDREFQDGAARRAMLDIFDLLGAGDGIVEHYRAELAKVLFS
jgi:putative thioredoxin